MRIAATLAASTVSSSKATARRQTRAGVRRLTLASMGGTDVSVGGTEKYPTSNIQHRTLNEINYGGDGGTEATEVMGKQTSK